MKIKKTQLLCLKILLYYRMSRKIFWAGWKNENEKDFDGSHKHNFKFFDVGCMRL